ncbi:glycoside hydrolase family 6 enzyme [Crucibulum laeve]|uniref:Glucanase n=1 Tax=Crucibulum laeve TaxID=68775 RepID=A0A5C3LY21_9AGAR|nr:glycoside hydrolase family 6 enzyme [Crucibulum laeve]
MHSFVKLLSVILAIVTLSDASPLICNYDNPFLGRVQYANSNYANSLKTTVSSFLAKNDTLNAARTRTVQGISTFLWIDSFNAIAGFEKHIDEAVKKQKSSWNEKLIFPFVIYNLPDRDCSAKASAGELELANHGELKYRQFVDRITSIVAARSRADQHIGFAVVIEPDSLANSVTNTGSVPKCATASDAYIRGVAYVVEKLGRMKNVALYIDVGHSNWLGWPGNLEPTAKVMSQVVAIANHNQTSSRNPAKVRGFVTNVSNYNGYNPTTPDIIYGAGPDNPNWSELRFAKALAPYLEAEGLPAHFIIDQGRSGQQNIRQSGGFWCNIDDAGFGTRPTTETGECIIDALVWVKPGGESDGTSDAAAARFDENCQSSDAKVPAPEAGTWFNGYVEMLVKNANPPLKPTYK